MLLMIEVGLSGYLRPSEMFNLQGGVIQAGNHDTLQPFRCFPKNVPSAPKLAQAIQLASGLIVAILARRPTGHRIWTFTWPHSSPWDHGGALPDQTLRAVHRQSTRPSVTRSSTAQRQVDTPEIHGPMREERSFDQTFHEQPERLQSYLTRSEAVLVNAMLGRLWEEVRHTFFADFVAGQGGMGRAVQSAFVGAASKCK